MSLNMYVRIFDKKIVLAGETIDLTSDEGQAIPQIFGSAKKLDDIENELNIMDLNCLDFEKQMIDAGYARRQYAQLKNTTKKNDPDNLKDHFKSKAKSMDGKFGEIASFLNTFEDKLNLFDEKLLEIKKLFNKKLQNESKLLGIFVSLNKFKKEHISRCRETLANLVNNRSELI